MKTCSIKSKGRKIMGTRYFASISFPLFALLLFSITNELNPMASSQITEEEAIKVVKETIQNINLHTVSYLSYLNVNKLTDYFDRHAKIIKLVLIKHFCNKLLPYFSPTTGITSEDEEFNIVAQATNNITVQCCQQQNNLFNIILSSSESEREICSIHDYPRPIPHVPYLLEYNNNENKKKWSFPFICFIEPKIDNNSPPILVIWHKKIGSICAEIPLPDYSDKYTFYLERKDYEGYPSNYTLMYLHEPTQTAKNFICIKCRKMDYSSLSIQQLILIAKLFFKKEIKTADHFYVENKNNSFSYKDTAPPPIDEHYWLLAYNKLPEQLKLFYESIMKREEMLQEQIIKLSPNKTEKSSNQLPSSFELRRHSEESLTSKHKKSISPRFTFKKKYSFGPTLAISNSQDPHQEKNPGLGQDSIRNSKIRSICSLDSIFYSGKSNTF